MVWSPSGKLAHVDVSSKGLKLSLSDFTLFCYQNHTFTAITNSNDPHWPAAWSFLPVSYAKDVGKIPTRPDSWAIKYTWNIKQLCDFPQIYRSIFKTIQVTLYYKRLNYDV